MNRVTPYYTLNVSLVHGERGSSEVNVEQGGLKETAIAARKLVGPCASCHGWLCWVFRDDNTEGMV